MELREALTPGYKGISAFWNASGLKLVGLITCNERAETVPQRSISVVLGTMQEEKEIYKSMSQCGSLSAFPVIMRR